jgi:hypothetical protein
MVLINIKSPGGDAVAAHQPILIIIVKKVLIIEKFYLMTNEFNKR